MRKCISTSSKALAFALAITVLAPVSRAEASGIDEKALIECVAGPVVDESTIVGRAIGWLGKLQSLGCAVGYISSKAGLL